MGTINNKGGKNELLKIAICDDESIFSEKISMVVKNYLNRKEIDVQIDCYDSGVAFVELKEDMDLYDIVFMDINMEQMDGIKASKIFRTFCPDTYLVFVTAFIKYTLEGYKVEAIRYILKEYDRMEADITEAMDTILEKIREKNEKAVYNFIGIGETEIALNEVMYVDSHLHRLTFHMSPKENKSIYKMYAKMNDIIKDFHSDYVVRIHQSFLANMKYVANIKRYEATLIDDTVIPISKRYYKTVQEMFLKQKGAI